MFERYSWTAFKSTSVDFNGFPEFAIPDFNAFQWFQVDFNGSMDFNGVSRFQWISRNLPPLHDFFKRRFMSHIQDFAIKRAQQMLYDDASS